MHTDTNTNHIPVGSLVCFWQGVNYAGTSERIIT